MKGKYLTLLFACMAVLLLSCRSISNSEFDINLPPSSVIFSFDDGPNPHGNTTARLLDVLKKYNVKAMFVLLGRNVDENPALVKRIYEEGHYIVNHGYAGKLSKQMREAEFLDNIIMGANAITGALGKELSIKYYRPHGGFYTPRQKDICMEAGFSIIPANIRVYDAIMRRRDSNKAVNMVLKKVIRRGGGIILIHDAKGSSSGMEEKLSKYPNGTYDRSWIPGAVEEIIMRLEANGFAIADPNLILKGS